MLLEQLHVLHSHDLVEKLLANAFERDHEVYEGDLRGEFWQVMGIRVASRHEQSELVSVVDISVAELDLLDSSDLEVLLQKDRVEQWVQVFANALK